MLARKQNIKTVHGHAHLHTVVEHLIICKPHNLQEPLAQLGWVILPKGCPNIQGRVIDGHRIQIDQVKIAV